MKPQIIVLIFVATIVALLTWLARSPGQNWNCRCWRCHCHQAEKDK